MAAKKCPLHVDVHPTSRVERINGYLGILSKKHPWYRGEGTSQSEI